jgi:N-terminal acetyltransferase B complex non-catalytic subunit
VDEMIAEWRTSLAFLPGVPPKDGGQKETLPGDEIVLLISQHLHLKASCESDTTQSLGHLIAAAALLEEAIEHSPYNANLKIASIGVYSRLKAAYRAFEHYEEMGVKYIQLDSCSYLILPLLIRGGLYTQAIKLSSAVIKFHGSTSKDVKEYSTKSFRKGYLLKAKEMVTFQREKMRPSVQLLEAKGIVMDCAALLNVADFTGTKQKCDVRLGAEKGLCGSEEDAARAEQLIRDAEIHFNAPSIIHSSSNTPLAKNLPTSDNRDMTVNAFEILHRRKHVSNSDMVKESLLKGHTQGLLVRAVMATEVAKAPKKGKIPKSSDDMTSRCESLLAALKKANELIDDNGLELSEISASLWKASGALCEGIAAVIQGSSDGDSNDSLEKREKSAVAAVELSTSSISKARGALESSSADGDTICQLLPDRIVPLFTLVETTARLFALFGWGKRKTKAPAAALASLAHLFKDFLSDALEIMMRFRAFVSSELSAKDVQLEIGADYLQKTITHVVESRGMTTDRVDPFLLQMKETLQTFANEES